MRHFTPLRSPAGIQCLTGSTMCYYRFMAEITASVNFTITFCLPPTLLPCSTTLMGAQSLFPAHDHSSLCHTNTVMQGYNWKCVYYYYYCRSERRIIFNSCLKAEMLESDIPEQKSMFYRGHLNANYTLKFKLLCSFTDVAKFNMTAIARLSVLSVLKKSDYKAKNHYKAI